jgi:hypothetical protein
LLLALGFRGVDDGFNGGDDVGGEAGLGRVAPDQLLAGRDVDAEEFIGGDVGLDPLDLRADVSEHGAGGLRRAASCSGVNLPRSGMLRSMRNFGISNPLL